MIKRAVFCLAVMLFSTTLCYASLPEIISIQGTTTPDNVYIEDLGMIPLTNNKILLKEIISQRESDIGRKIEVGNEIFIPASDKTSAYYGAVNDSIILKTFSSLQEGYVQRIFYGPSVVNSNGLPLDDVNIWFVNCGGYTKATSGPVNPSVYMPNSQKTVQAVLYKTGYKLKVINVPISNKALHNSETKLPLATSNIVLEPADNRIFTIKVVNYLSTLYKNAETSFNYYVNSNGEYSFAFTVIDPVENKTLTIGHLLSSQTMELPAQVELETINGSNSADVISNEKLPLSIPRIKIVPSLILADIPTETNPQKGFDDKKTDVSKQSIFSVILFFLLCFSFLCHVIYKRLKRTRMLAVATEVANKNIHTIKMLSVCNLDKEAFCLLENVKKITKEEKLNPKSKEVLKDTLSKIEKLFDEINRHLDNYFNLRKTYLNCIDLRKKEIVCLEKALASSNYDIALTHKQSIIDTEAQQKSLQQAIQCIDDTIDAKKSSVEALVAMLEKMYERSKALIAQEDGLNDLSELASQVKNIMQKTKASLEDDFASDILDPGKIKNLQKARHESQQTGIKINDVEDLKDFLKKRS